MHPKPVSSRKRPSDAADRERFKALVLAMDGGRCCVHDYETDCEDGLEAHHVITQQQLRLAGRHDLLWDPRNGMTVCGLIHRRHTTAVQRIPADKVPERCAEFARREAFDFESIIARYYRDEGENT